MKRKIDLESLPLKNWKKEATMFQDDYTAGAGTSWLLNVAKAENKMIWEMIRAIEEAPTLTPQNEWVSVEERLPELPKEKYCWVCVLGCRKSSKRCMPMFYERTVVRGKTVERWKDIWDRIANELPDYWMPLPAPPDRRPPGGEEKHDGH